MFGKTKIAAENIWASWGWDKFVKRETLLSSLFNDRLILKVSMYLLSPQNGYSQSWETSVEFEERESAIERQRTLLFDFAQFYKSEEYPDIVFVIEEIQPIDDADKASRSGKEEESGEESNNKKIIEKVIKAHKGILIARSVVFKAMFSSVNEMRESNEGEVRITDIEYNVFREMLHYVYCGVYLFSKRLD